MSKILGFKSNHESVLALDPVVAFPKDLEIASAHLAWPSCSSLNDLHSWTGSCPMEQFLVSDCTLCCGKSWTLGPCWTGCWCFHDSCATRGDRKQEVIKVPFWNSFWQLRCKRTCRRLPALQWIDVGRRHVDEIVMEMDDPIVLQGKTNGVSFGWSKQDTEKIHKDSQRTLTISFMFLRWSQNDCRCSTTAHCGT